MQLRVLLWFVMISCATSYVISCAAVLVLLLATQCNFVCYCGLVYYFAVFCHVLSLSEGGMIRLETLIELRFLNSSFSSSNFSIRAFRACPLFEIRQTFPCRAIRGKSSDSRQQYLSQQNPPHSRTNHRDAIRPSTPSLLSKIRVRLDPTRGHS